LQQYELQLSQTTPATPGQEHKQPFHIPLLLGLLDAHGNDMNATCDTASPGDGSYLVELTQNMQQFIFKGVAEKPVLSILRGFSAPIKLAFERPDAELAFCMGHDGDEFNRWEAAQQLGVRIILRMIAADGSSTMTAAPDYYIDACRKTLLDKSLDKALSARALALPSHAYVAEAMSVIDVDGIHAAREQIHQQLADALHQHWLSIYETNHSDQFDLTPLSMGQRFLKNLALSYLMYAANQQGAQIALQQYRSATNMTDQLAAFRAIVHHETPDAEAVIADFYGKWRHDPLVMDKWFTIQAMAPGKQTLARVKTLFQHADFDLKNPNRVRALLGSLSAANPVVFHASDGEGYRLLGKYLAQLDALNPQIAARLSIVLTRWKRYDEPRQQLMQAELQRLLELPGLSRDVYELVSKSLPQA
jgi:aminopeptidase N